MANQETTQQTPKVPISVTIKDQQVLQAAYMSFLKLGGLFIPINKSFAIGQEVSLNVTLLLSEPGEKFSLDARVIWLTPQKAQGNKASGIGVEFLGQTGISLRQRIEKILGESLQSEEATHTM